MVHKSKVTQAMAPFMPLLALMLGHQYSQRTESPSISQTPGPRPSQSNGCVTSGQPHLAPVPSQGTHCHRLFVVVGWRRLPDIGGDRLSSKAWQLSPNPNWLNRPPIVRKKGPGSARILPYPCRSDVWPQVWSTCFHSWSSKRIHQWQRALFESTLTFLFTQLFCGMLAPGANRSIQQKTTTWPQVQ